MDKINSVLTKYGSKLSDLSDGLKAQVMELQETVKKYNTALDAFESSNENDADAEAALEATEKYIDENEEALANSIEAELAEKVRVEKEKDENEEALANSIEAELAEKVRVEKEKKEKEAEEKNVAPEKKIEKEEEKSGGTFGWIIAGALAAVGLGFLFKNKG